MYCFPPTAHAVQILFSIGWILKSVELCSYVEMREAKSQGEVQGYIEDSTGRLIVILDLRESLGLERDFEMWLQ